MELLNLQLECSFYLTILTILVIIISQFTLIIIALTFRIIIIIITNLWADRRTGSKEMMLFISLSVIFQIAKFMSLVSSSELSEKLLAEHDGNV